MSDFILYVKTGCPWCKRVLDFADQKGITFDIRNIADASVADELIKRGGKRQVTYLVDIKNAVEMYESADIVGYLKSDSNN
jgi:glutaredoxin 3